MNGPANDKFIDGDLEDIDITKCITQLNAQVDLEFLSGQIEESDRLYAPLSQNQHSDSRCSLAAANQHLDGFHLINKLHNNLCTTRSTTKMPTSC